MPDQLTPIERRMRASIAARRRHHPDDPSIERLERDYKASRLEAYIRQQVESAPRLSDAQRDALARILRPTHPVPTMPGPEDFARELFDSTFGPMIPGAPTDDYDERIEGVA